MYDLKTGRRETRAGNPVRRPLNVLPSCNTCPKVPASAPPVPSSAVELSDANAACYAHYRECRAVGVWPDDDRCRRNAALIREAEDVIERARADGTRNLLATLAAAVRPQG